MSFKRISQFFNPNSVAVIGASINPGRAGYVVMRNLLQGGFKGAIMPVTNKYQAVHGVLAYPSIQDLPQGPDLAVICTNKNTLDDILTQLSNALCQHAIVLAAGLTSPEKHTLTVHAKEKGINLLGSNSLGLLIPRLGLNASFSHTVAKDGKLAFISQSAAVCSTILDWANNKRIGFSYFLSVGDCLDIGFDELLDFLSRDPKTQAILLYIDTIKDVRRFISAARAAAYTKPIIVIKTGRTEAGAKAAHLHTGGTKIINDAVYDAIFQRAGMLRVDDLRELFAATQTLASHPKLLKEEPLTIVTNGGGPAIMAVDALLQRSGQLATLTADTLHALSNVLPKSNAINNPIDMYGDASPQSYKKVLSILLGAPEIKNLLIIHTPSALAPSEEYASIITDALSRIPKMSRPFVMTNFMGEGSAFSARTLSADHNIPTYRTPEGAVGAFMHLVNYRRNQKHLSQTPESLGNDTLINSHDAKKSIRTFIKQGHKELSTHLSASILTHYGINCNTTLVALTPSEAKEQAIKLGFPVALKLISPSITSKSDVGGVILNLNDANEVEQSAFALLLRVKSTYSDATIDGFSLQKMVPRAGTQELRIAVKTQLSVGPVILLGEAGTGLEFSLCAVALPPLNMNLAKYLIAGALDKGVLKDTALPEKVDKYRLCALLTRLSQLVVEQPDIDSIELNPVLASGGELLVLDASIILNDYKPSQNLKRLAIKPYPKEWVKEVTLKNGKTATLRPIKPEDERAHQEFDNALTKEDRYRRFFSELPEFNHEQLAKMTQIDYDREMAFIITQAHKSSFRTLGVSRVLMEPDNHSAEFSVIVRSDSHGLGIGHQLLNTIIDYCKMKNVSIIQGITLPENTGMIALSKKLGFSITRDFQEGIINMVLRLKDT